MQHAKISELDATLKEHLKASSSTKKLNVPAVVQVFMFIKLTSNTLQIFVDIFIFKFVKKSYFPNISNINRFCQLELEVRI